MKISTALSVLLGSASVTAIPVLPRQPLPQSYSVVPVDGGSGIPATVTQTAVITSMATIVVTDSESVTTIVVPQTVTVMAGPPWVTPTVTVSESVSSSAYDNGQWHTTYYAKSTALVTLATASTSRNTPPRPTMTSSPSPWTEAHSTELIPWAAATTSAVPDPGSWQAWSNQGNNGMWNEGS